MRQPVTIVIIVALVVWVIYRRMRPQPVRPARAVLIAAIIIVLLASSLVSTGPLTASPLAFILAVPALVVGAGLGLLLVRSIRFWRDETSGALWMQGGIVYIAVWLATIALRIGVGYAAGTFAPQGTTPTTHHTIHPALAVLSADLLFVSMGLWIARAAALVMKYRQNRSASTPAIGASVAR